MAKIKVSIIIPHYKRLEQTKQAIYSVLRQKEINQKQLEIIVSDEDRQKTDKNTILSLSPNIIYIVNKNQEGPGGNRQTGLEIARGEYVVFLDSDDQQEPTFIRHSLKTLRKPQAVASVCLSKSFFEPGFSLIDKIRLIPLMIIRDTSLFFSLLLNQGYVYLSAFYLCQLSHMMFKASALKNFKFNYDYRHGGEDWDLVIHVLNQAKIKIIPKKLLNFRYSPKSSSSSNKNRLLKWKSYSLLTSRLPDQNKQGLFYQLFLYYIRLFRGNN